LDRLQRPVPRLDPEGGEGELGRGRKGERENEREGGRLDSFVARFGFTVEPSRSHNLPG
jgi:hypothetical protein